MRRLVTAAVLIATIFVAGDRALAQVRSPPPLVVATTSAKPISKLTPAKVRSTLVRTAHPIAGSRNDCGAGVIDASSAVNSLPH